MIHIIWRHAYTHTEWKYTHVRASSLSIFRFVQSEIHFIIKATRILNRYGLAQHLCT